MFSFTFIPAVQSVKRVYGSLPDNMCTPYDSMKLIGPKDLSKFLSDNGLKVYEYDGVNICACTLMLYKLGHLNR